MLHRDGVVRVAEALQVHPEVMLAVGGVSQTDPDWGPRPLVAKALWSTGLQEGPRHDKMGPLQMPSWDIPLPDTGRCESSLTFEVDPFR